MDWAFRVLFNFLISKSVVRKVPQNVTALCRITTKKILILCMVCNVTKVINDLLFLNTVHAAVPMDGSPIGRIPILVVLYREMSMSGIIHLKLDNYKEILPNRQ